ncbi:hypothetical protein [Streptomyces atratus]|uniref:hypothetical protein n=1 Tax=Streptomyces atratus TaxID=1893 RepID=UPI00365EB712
MTARAMAGGRTVRTWDISGAPPSAAAAWLLRVMVDYHREPVGWQARVIVGRTGPVPSGGRFPETVTAVMEQAQALADATRRPVRVIHGVDGKPDRFLPTLKRFAADIAPFTSPVWAAIPEPVAAAASS